MVGQHPFHGLLRHQESAKGADRNRLRDIGGNEVDEGAARPPAGVVDDEVGYRDFTLDQPEQALDLVGLGRVAGKRACAGLAAERAELFDLAGRQRNPNAFAGKYPRQRGAEAFAGADNEGGFILRDFHGRFPYLE